MQNEQCTFSVYVESPNTMGRTDCVAFNFVRGVEDPIMHACDKTYALIHDKETYDIHFDELCQSYPDAEPFFTSIHQAAYDAGIESIIDHIAEHQYFVFRLVVADNHFVAALMWTGWEKQLNNSIREILK